MTVIQERKRIKLAAAFIGDVRAWKSNDPEETLLIAIKNPAVDADDTSFYVLPRDAIEMTYIGTTALGKDGGVQPFGYKDGRVGALITETPIAGQGGAAADLWYVLFEHKLDPEIVTDTWLRQQMKGLLVTLSQVFTNFAARF